jgi:F-type H+-transporting ATPase subunit b
MHLTLPPVTTVAAASSHPLVDVDLTIFIQLIVFLGVWFVSKKWIWGPYLDLRDRRSAGIEGARKEAETASSAADAELKRYEDLLGDARQRAQESRRDIQKDAIAAQKEITDKARVETGELLSQAQKDIANETAKARQTLLARADEISRDMASRLLGREVA